MSGLRRCFSCCRKQHERVSSCFSLIVLKDDLLSAGLASPTSYLLTRTKRLSFMKTHKVCDRHVRTPRNKLQHQSDQNQVVRAGPASPGLAGQTRTDLSITGWSNLKWLVRPALSCPDLVGNEVL